MESHSQSISGITPHTNHPRQSLMLTLGDIEVPTPGAFPLDGSPDAGIDLDVRGVGFHLIWGRGRELNPQPELYRSPALPIELPRHVRGDSNFTATISLKENLG